MTHIASFGPYVWNSLFPEKARASGHTHSDIRGRKWNFFCNADHIFWTVRFDLHVYNFCFYTLTFITCRCHEMFTFPEYLSLYCRLICVIWCHFCTVPCAIDCLKMSNINILFHCDGVFKKCKFIPHDWIRNGKDSIKALSRFTMAAK